MTGRRRVHGLAYVVATLWPAYAVAAMREAVIDTTAGADAAPSADADAGIDAQRFDFFLDPSRSEAAPPAPETPAARAVPIGRPRTTTRRAVRPPTTRLTLEPIAVRPDTDAPGDQPTQAGAGASSGLGGVRAGVRVRDGDWLYVVGDDRRRVDLKTGKEELLHDDPRALPGFGSGNARQIGRSGLNGLVAFRGGELHRVSVT